MRSFILRPPICIVGDGLYPNSTVFNICWDNGWDFIITFQEVNLPISLKNYYQCLQIAHIINQLTQKSTTVAELLSADPKMTIKYLWEKVISFMDE